MFQIVIHLISHSRQTMKHNNSLIKTLTRVQSHILKGHVMPPFPKKVKEPVNFWKTMLGAFGDIFR